MKCFTHQQTDAVGICKYCAKGACLACALDTGSGLACSEACNTHIVRLAELMKSANAAASINKQGAGYFLPAFLMVLGTLFSVHAWFFARPGQTSFGLVMGSLFIVFGLVLGIIHFQWRKRSNPARQT